MSRCKGFPYPSPCPNEAITRAGIWCPECDEKRKKHITKQLEAEADRMGVEVPWERDPA